MDLSCVKIRGLSPLTLLFFIVFACCLALPVTAQESAEKSSAAASQDEPTVPVIEAPPESETPPPLEIDVPSESEIGIRKEIQSLRDSLQQRREALAQLIDRKDYADSRLERLQEEYESLKVRLDTAGLGLTENYAKLLQRRLERLEQQHLARNLAIVVNEQLDAARIEQFRLEEIGAVLTTGDDVDRRLTEERERLLADLKQAVGDHIEVLNSYFKTISDLQNLIASYKVLVRQRLFWLPSEQPVSQETVTGLLGSVSWLVSPSQWTATLASVPESFRSRWLSVSLLALGLVVVVGTRKKAVRQLLETGESVGNVGRDRIGLTAAALGYSVFLALPWVLLLTLVAVLVDGNGEFGEALAKGFRNAALLMLLLGVVHHIAVPGGLADRHFQWQPKTLLAIRRGLPRLLLVLLPGAIILRLTESPVGAEYNTSLGRLVFCLVSIALALFAHRLMVAIRKGNPVRDSSTAYRLMHTLAVVTPLGIAVISLAGYHYTALQLEGTLFNSVWWLVLVATLYFIGLRSLAVRERRLRLIRLREQRVIEQKEAEARESAGPSGEGRPAVLELPEMDLHDISAQSTTLLRFIALALVLAGFWLLWSPVIPALRIFDDIILWTVGQGEDSLAITLGDLGLSLIIAGVTVLAARNLPGTLEVAILSRMNLAPGSGYAITTVVTYVIVFLGVTMSLGVLGAQWSKLQWLVAALGVGLGFGLQEIVANFVSGIILLFERPIRVGDTVTISGVTGTVSRIRIRATTLVDWDRKEQIIPNKTFVTQDLTNWTLTDPITRVIITVGVAYGSDVDQVQALLSALAQENSRVVEDPPPAVFCTGLGDSSINFEMRVFVRGVSDIMPMSHDLRSAVTRKLKDAGIEIPFPQRDIHIRSAVPMGAGLQGTSGASGEKT